VMVRTVSVVELVVAPRAEVGGDAYSGDAAVSVVEMCLSRVLWA
jgi:hypothetical protein